MSQNGLLQVATFPGHSSTDPLSFVGTLDPGKYSHAKERWGGSDGSDVDAEDLGRRSGGCGLANEAAGLPEEIQGLKGRAENASLSEPERGRVVVGVDGSPSSLVALEWAGHEAERLGAILDIRVLWMPPAVLGTMAPIGAGDYVTSAQLMADEAAAFAREQWPELEIEYHVTEAMPAPALVEASRRATLLVVGSRGAGGFRGLLVGSVSQHCIEHARCPVMVVRGRSKSDEDQ